MQCRPSLTTPNDAIARLVKPLRRRARGHPSPAPNFYEISAQAAEELFKSLKRRLPIPSFRLLCFVDQRGKEIPIDQEPIIIAFEQADEKAAVDVILSAGQGSAFVCFQ